MLRIRLDINRAPIGTIGVWNTEEHRIRETDEAENGFVNEIRYQVHDLRGHQAHGGHIEDYPHLADVWHDQEGDAATLTAAVMEEVGDEPLIPLTDGRTSQYQDTDNEP